MMKELCDHHSVMDKGEFYQTYKKAYNGPGWYIWENNMTAYVEEFDCQKIGSDQKPIGMRLQVFHWEPNKEMNGYIRICRAFGGILGANIFRNVA